MEIIENEMFLHLLSRVAFDTSRGCWFVPEDATWYIGRALYTIWFGACDEEYSPSPLCKPRYDKGVFYPCFNPEHVEKHLRYAAQIRSGLAQLEEQAA